MMDTDPPPWWREVTGSGWGLLLLAAFATFSFVLGLVTGETLFLASWKAKSGPGHLTGESSPLLFFAALLLNGGFAIAMWTLFARWMLRRRRMHEEAMRVDRGAGPPPGTRYDPKSRTRTRVEKTEVHGPPHPGGERQEGRAFLPRRGTGKRR